jgi:hypothetical protein
VKVRRLKSSWNAKKSTTATKNPIKWQGWSCWLLPPLLAFSFIINSLNYLSHVEQQFVSRIFPIKIKDSPQLQQQLCEFIFSYHQALLQNDATELMPFYAETVNYYQLGKISRQIVSEEKDQYFKRWQYVE